MIEEKVYVRWTLDPLSYYIGKVLISFETLDNYSNLWEGKQVAMSCMSDVVNFIHRNSLDDSLDYLEWIKLDLHGDIIEFKSAQEFLMCVKPEVLL